MNKKQAIEEIDMKIRELRINLYSRCKANYPHKADREGWEIYGRLQGLAWARIRILDRLDISPTRKTDKANKRHSKP